MINKLKKKGVSLIVLLIVIAVTAIISSVFIAIFVGDNSVLSNAKRAKEESTIASFNEELSTIYTELVSNGYTNFDTLPMDYIQAELERNGFPVRHEADINIEKVSLEEGKIVSIEVGEVKKVNVKVTTTNNVDGVYYVYMNDKYYRLIPTEDNWIEAAQDLQI